jgi:hypothetical protein
MQSGNFPVVLEMTMTTILIIVVLFVLLGGGGYFGFRGRR